MSNKTFKLPKAVCKRCGHEWTPRRSNPEMCPKCKSPYWHREREREVEPQEKPVEEIQQEEQPEEEIEEINIFDA